MTLQTMFLTNTAYGYPTRGAARRVDPIALACLHITANPDTPPATALQERTYANRASSGGPSAHLYLDPNGSGIWTIDPDKYAAWSNGDVRSPRTAVPGISALLEWRKTALPGAILSANEAYDLTIEQVGRYPDYPLTLAQMKSAALVIAQRSLVRNLPIERRTVHLHSDLNTETRPNCPVPSANREAYVAKVIRFANEYRQGLELAQVREELAKSQAMVLDYQTRYASAAGQVTSLTAQVIQLEASRTEALLQRDEALGWAKRLRSHMGAGLAIDAPDWTS